VAGLGYAGRYVAVCAVTCCKAPNIANSDHKEGLYPHAYTMINRACLRCGQHWYGEEGSVREFTRTVWDHMMNTAFDPYELTEAGRAIVSWEDAP